MAALCADEWRGGVCALTRLCRPTRLQGASPFEDLSAGASGSGAHMPTAEASGKICPIQFLGRFGRRSLYFNQEAFDWRVRQQCCAAITPADLTGEIGVGA